MRFQEAFDSSGIVDWDSELESLALCSSWVFLGFPRNCSLKKIQIAGLIDPVTVARDFESSGMQL